MIIFFVFLYFNERVLDRHHIQSEIRLCSAIFLNPMTHLHRKKQKNKKTSFCVGQMTRGKVIHLIHLQTIII
jgi:hypothetical protein